MSDGEVCIANIGPRERRKRMRFGVAGLAVGVAMAVAFAVLGLPRPWRLAVLPAFLAGAAGWFQATEHT